MTAGDPTPTPGDGAPGYGEPAPARGEGASARGQGVVEPGDGVLVPLMPRVSPGWLALREPADASARAPELVALLRDQLARGAAGVVVHDLGSGTGSMARWLAPRLPGPQHWIMYDRDPDLLEHAAAAVSGAAAEPVSAEPVTAEPVTAEPLTVETRHRDIASLTAADLGGDPGGDHRGAVHVVTASALLDLLTAEEVERIAAACAQAATPALLTLSVTGRVRLTPPDPLDDEVAEAFNAHQRRTVGDRRLLGPDAVTVAAGAFGRSGARVRIRPSPWLLGPDRAELTSEWFTGWLSAAREQRPELTRATASYGRRRLAEATAGRLGVEVEHRDLFVQHG